MQPASPSAPDLKNLMLAVILATIAMMGWHFLYEAPREKARLATVQRQRAEAAREETAKQALASDVSEAPMQTGPRITIDTPRLHGSMPLTGNRIDALTLATYRETLANDSNEVVLLKPAAEKDAYFAEFGVLAKTMEVPGPRTAWKADHDRLTPQQPVTLTWENGDGVTFRKTIAIDDDYMFTVNYAIENGGDTTATLYPYGLISRNYADVNEHYLIMHEGPLAVTNGVLTDTKYEDLREDGAQKFADARGWVGITDKYWLTALIPDTAMAFDAKFDYFKRAGQDAYQVDLRGKALTVPAGDSAQFTLRLFAGAKEVQLLDHYRTQLDVPLFDRAVDFGSLYFLTKPIFLLLNFFHGLVGNFGIAILLLVCCIKLLLFPLANKSFTSMSQMKLLLPQMNELKERYADDKMKMNMAVMELYKREGVNPMSGCLPILIQIPIFLSLYKVLFVTLEMRHAPFFGWIDDLSAPDPTNLFTLFGLVPWDAPSFLHIGVWPIIMCITMVLQQKLNPKPADPLQATVIGYMPYVFLFLFAKFPAGLVIYWAWNNLLSILQQGYIQQRLKKRGPVKKSARKK